MNLFIKPALATLFMGAFLFTTVLTSCDNDDDEEEDVTYSLSGVANGANERPNPVTTTATGDITGEYNSDTKQLSYTITWNGLKGAPVAMHFHGPAGINEAANPVVHITVPTGAGTT